MPSTTSQTGSEPERVAFYLRVSGEEQVERMSIDTQEEFLEQYSDLYGLKVVGTYRDEGVSGTVPMHERPAGGRLLENAAAGKLDVVLVYKLDRVGRTLLNVVDAHDRLSTAGVALRSSTEPIDTATPSGRLIFHMLASFAEFERGSIQQRTTHGLHRAYRDGRQSGIIPYGFDVDEDGRLIVVEEEAQVVREIISNIASGSTLYAEVARLDALGVPGPGRKYAGEPRRYSEKWTVATMSKLVHRSVYGGTRRYRTGTGAEGIETECPSVVEPELQQKAVSRLAENRRFNKKEGNRRYLLTGLIRCAVCGSPFVGHPAHARGQRRNYYKCNDDRPERRRKAGKGHAPCVRAEWIEGLVWQDVKRFLENPGEVLKQLKERAAADEEAGALQQRWNDLSKRLRTTQAEKDRYVKLYAQGHLDDAELDTYLRDVNIRADNLRLLLGSVEAELSEKSEQKHLTETTAAWLATLRERTGEVEADTEEAFSKRRELVKLLVAYIIAGRDEEGRLRVEITYRFDPPTDPTGTRQDAGEQSSDVVSVSNPQGWAWPKPRPDRGAFAKGAREIGLSPVVVHSKYLINLASPESEHRERSTEVLAAELVAAEALGAHLVVAHPGSHMGSGEEKGTDQLVESLARARELAGNTVVDLVLENSVGAGTQLCSTFDALAGVAEKAGVRVCVDTAHAYVAGYDLSTPEGAREVAVELEATLGERIALLHLNDARNELGSRRDGHKRIGVGRVASRKGRGWSFSRRCRGFRW